MNIIQRDEIKNQIYSFKEKKPVINKEYANKTVDIREEIESKYNHKINELKTNFKDKLENLDSINDQINTLKEKGKKIKKKLKSIRKEISTISDQKDKSIRLEIKKINMKRKQKINEINKNIKVLKKEL